MGMLNKKEKYLQLFPSSVVDRGRNRCCCQYGQWRLQLKRPSNFLVGFYIVKENRLVLAFSRDLRHVPVLPTERRLRNSLERTENDYRARCDAFRAYCVQSFFAFRNRGAHNERQRSGGCVGYRQRTVGRF